MKLPVKISFACEGDLKEVLSLYYNSSKEILNLKSITPMLKYDEKEYGKDYEFLSYQNLRKWFNRNKDSILIAKVNGRVVGFILFSVIKNIGYIEEIHVKKGYRRRGIGTSLLKKAEEYLMKNKKVSLFFVECWRKSAPFFVLKGYFPLYHEEELYMNKLDYVDMVKLPKHSIVKVTRKLFKSILNGSKLRHFDKYVETFKEFIEVTNKYKMKSFYLYFTYLIILIEYEKFHEAKNLCERLLSKKRRIDESLFLLCNFYNSIYLSNNQFSVKKLNDAKSFLRKLHSLMKEDFVWSVPVLRLVKEYISYNIYYVNKLIQLLGYKDL